MNPIGKKFISLFLIFFLFTVNCEVLDILTIPVGIPTGKTKKGAELIVTQIDGQQIKGELIIVKPNSLLILNSEGKDVSVDIEEIKRIEVKKKSKFMTMVGIGGAIGFLIGGGIGVAAGLDSPGELGPAGAAVLGGMAYGMGGALAGALLGALIGLAIADTHARKYKTFQIEGMTDSEIKETMNYLRKKARVRDYK